MAGVVVSCLLLIWYINTFTVNLLCADEIICMREV